MALIENKKAHFNYEFLETIEAGVELLGTEVKSIKAHHGSLNGAYVSLLGGELYLLGAHVPAWQEKNIPESFDPYRSRKLLVRAKELISFKKALQTKGLTIVPISLYSKGRYIKAQIAVAKGKKNFDKRETLKKRDLDREVQKEVF